MKTNPAPVVDYDDPVSKVLDELLRSGTATIVTQGGKYYGVIDDRHLHRGLRDPAHSKCGHVSVRAPSLLPASRVYDGLQAFMAGHFKALPVVDEKGKPVGIITRTDVLEELLALQAIPRMAVSVMMNVPVYTMEAGQTLGDARRIMKEKNSHRLLVMENGRPRGIVSTFDLVGTSVKPKERKGKNIISEVYNMNEKRVDEVLREGFGLVKEDEDIVTAAEKMVKRKVSSLLVTHEGKYIGVIAATDIFKYLLREMDRNEFFISISGLHEEEKRFIPEIQASIQAVLRKFSKSFKINNVALHFKKGKSAYVGNLSLSVNGQPLALKVEEYDFQTALNALATELYILLRKQKDRREQRKRR